MNDDPTAVDVLYLQVHEADGGRRLLAVCGKRFFFVVVLLFGFNQFI